MIALQQHADGILFAVKAHAGARTNGISGEHDGALKVSVTQAPEKGKANKAIVEVLADALRLSKHNIELRSGATTNQKMFFVRGVAMDELQRRIANALPSRG